MNMSTRRLCRQLLIASKRSFHSSSIRSTKNRSPIPTTASQKIELPRAARLDSVQSNSPHHFYQNKVLEKYAVQPINPSTLRQFIFFGRQMNTDRILKSANWVRNELLVRLAHRIRDFQQLPFFVGTNPHIEYVYRLYWGAFESIRLFPPVENHEDNLQFCELLKNLLEDGLLVLPRLVQGISESTAYFPPEKKDLDLFLNRMLRSRISRRVLAEQHLALTDACEHQFDHQMGFGDGYVGIIFVHCSAKEILERSKKLVYQHIDRYHSEKDNKQAPLIDVKIHQNEFTADNSRNEILFAYVPEQLEHILYELLDNAVRYSMINNPDGNYPSIQVTVSANESDVYFRVSDRGGGMAKEKYDSLWSYQSRAQTGDFSEMNQVQKVPASIDDRASQAYQMGHSHLGIGLTMSRVYAEYWGGELQVMTMYGYGTDAYVRIPRLGTNIENLGIEHHSHPVFHHSSRVSNTVTPHRRKQASKNTSKKGNELRLLSDPNAPPSSTLHLLPPEQQLSHTTLTKESFSGNGWSESHMIQS